MAENAKGIYMNAGRVSRCFLRKIEVARKVEIDVRSHQKLEK